MDDRARPDEEGEPVSQRLTRVGSQREDGRECPPRAAAEPGGVGDEQAIHLGHGPGADGEVAASEPEHQRRGRNRERGRHETCEEDGGERVHAQVVGQHDQRVPAETDVGLLADRDEPGVAGQEVPHLRENQQRDELDEHSHQAPGTPERKRGEHKQHDGAGHGPDPARPGPTLDDEGRLRHWVPLKRPVGRTNSTARNTRCPVRMPQPGENLAPIVWATPRIMPPARVPHSDPSPPMMTASKANSSRSGPLLGPKVVRMPRKTPATPTMARARAMATPYRRRLSIPISSAASWSSEVARSARPSDVPLMNSWRPITISTATTNVMSGNQPIASSLPIAMLAVSILPGFRRWESAEKTSSNARSGLISVTRTTTRAKKAARMLRSPWARLTSRITPKIRDNPVAKSA